MNLPISYKSVAVLILSIVVAFGALYLVQSKTPVELDSYIPSYSDPMPEAPPLRVSIKPEKTIPTVVGEDLVLTVSLPETPREAVSGLALRVVLPVGNEEMFSTSGVSFYVPEELGADGWRVTINKLQYDELSASIIADISLLNLEPDGGVLTNDTTLATLTLKPTSAMLTGVIKIDEDVSELILKNDMKYKLVLDETGYSVLE